MVQAHRGESQSSKASTISIHLIPTTISRSENGSILKQPGAKFDLSFLTADYRRQICADFHRR